MNFLHECASRLNDGVSAQDVLSDMRLRYKTVRCLNVKTCLVRGMCKPSRAYTEALDALCVAHPDDRDDIAQGRSTKTDIKEAIMRLPPKWNENVLQLKPTRTQMKECKRLGAQSVVRKNKKRVRVHGRKLLATARCALSDAGKNGLVELAFALMLVTGRRTCEILNGRSCFKKVGDYAVSFCGVAKRRGYAPTIIIPVLAPANVVCSAIDVLRELQKNITLSNMRVSTRYQSLLCRNLVNKQPWNQCVKVHGLRGIYACMALQLFRWEDDASDAYVAMCILGHTGLHESLAYTTYHLGEDFVCETRLGLGKFTPPHWVASDGVGTPSRGVDEVSGVSIVLNLFVVAESAIAVVLRVSSFGP
jgi:hypothetical protein